MSLDTFDGLRLCLNCEDQYTTGILCTSCNHQFMIDRAEGFKGTAEEWCRRYEEPCPHDWVPFTLEGESGYQCSICGLIDI